MSLYYQASGITVYHGRMEDYQDVGGDVLITDPSYGTRTYDTDASWDAQLIRAWRDRFASVAIMGYPELLVSWCVEAGVVPDEWITWWPTNKTGARCLRVPRSTEHIAIFGATPGAKLIRRPRSPSGVAILDQEEKIKDRSRIKIQELAGKSTRDWAQEGDVWRDPAPGMMFNSHLRKHPNEKPLSLGNKLVTLCSEPGQTVVDYFAGSGAFVYAAHQAGRKAIAVELDERHCETIAERFRLPGMLREVG